jgi:hypothetical protein
LNLGRTRLPCLAHDKLLILHTFIIACREEAFKVPLDLEEGQRSDVEESIEGPSRFIEATGNLGVAVKPTLPDPYDIPEPNERLDADNKSDTASLRPPGSPQSEHSKGDRIVPEGRH